MRFSPCDMLGEKHTLTETPCSMKCSKNEPQRLTINQSKILQRIFMAIKIVIKPIKF